LLFGLMCGEIAAVKRARARRRWPGFFLAGFAGLLLGQVLNQTGVCPAGQTYLDAIVGDLLDGMVLV